MTSAAEPNLHTVTSSNSWIASPAAWQKVSHLESYFLVTGAAPEFILNGARWSPSPGISGGYGVPRSKGFVASFTYFFSAINTWHPKQQLFIQKKWLEITKHSEKKWLLQYFTPFVTVFFWAQLVGMLPSPKTSVPHKTWECSLPSVGVSASTRVS